MIDITLHLITKDYDLYSSTEQMGKNTFEIKVFDLANNRNLLRLLKLFYFSSNSYDERGNSFTSYLGAFLTNGDSAEVLKNNPTIRIFIKNKELLKEISLLLSN